MAFWNSKDPAEKARDALESARKKFIKKATRAFADKDWDAGVTFMQDAIAADKAPPEKHPVTGEPLESFSRKDNTVSLLQLCAREKGLYRLYVLSKLDAEDLAGICRAGKISWPVALEAKAACATPRELTDFMRAAKDVFGAKDLNAALRRAVISQSAHEMTGGDGLYDATYKWYYFGNAPENATLLLQKGADLASGNADLLLRAVDQLNLDMVKALVDGGANLMDAGNKAWQRAEEKKNEKADIIAQYLKTQLQHHAKNMMADAQTLVVTKSLDLQGSQLKLVFNFEARRVTEIFSAPGADGLPPQAAMVSHRFEDYDTETLKSAFDDLVALGGQPRILPESTTTVDKPALEKPRHTPKDAPGL